MRTWRRVRRALSRDFIEETAFQDPLDSLRDLSAGAVSRNRHHRARYLQVKTALPDDVLTCLDRASAALSLDVRLPLLDRSLVEAAALLPPSQYGWLQKLSNRALPPQSMQPDPERVEARVAAWLRGPLAATVSDALLSGRFRHRGVFDHKAVTRLWQQHLTGRRDHHETLWSMLMLELWFQQFVDGTESATRAA